MRTTVDLDRALLKRIRIEARERGLSVKSLLDLVIRRGLTAPTPTARKYSGPTFAMGEARTPDLTKALRLAGSLNDEELARDFRLRK